MADLRGDPVKVNLLIRTQMTKKAALLTDKKRLPYRLRVWSHGVDHRTPILPDSLRRPDLVEDQTQESACGAR
jgi:hypothetical protein